MKIRTTRIAIALTLGLGTAAHAAGPTATLVAGPLEPDGSTNRMRCNILNVSTKVVTVTVEVLDQTGAIVDIGDATFDPGKGGFLSAFDSDLSGFGWCRFTVQGKASAIRATASIFESGEGGRGNLAAVAAH